MTGYQISEDVVTAALSHTGDILEMWSCFLRKYSSIITVSATSRLRGVLDVVIVDIIRYLINRTFASHSPHPVAPVVWQPGTWHHDGWNI